MTKFRLFSICLLVGLTVAACGEVATSPEQSTSEITSPPVPSASEPAATRPDAPLSVFSWDAAVLEGEARAELIDTMQTNNIETVYQWLSRKQTDETYEDFAAALAAEGREVYALTGDPSWYTHSNLPDLYEAIDRVANLSSYSGIVLDVEPHVLDDYKENRSAIMAEYTEVMQAAYAYAAQKELKVILCIPAHWDDLSELEVLVSTACDALCVMNYFVGSEYDTILQEAAYAQQYDRELIHISELQPVGVHGITERNTYHGESLAVLHETWVQLERRFSEKLPTLSFSFSYHNYQSLLEMTAAETP